MAPKESLDGSGVLLDRLFQLTEKTGGLAAAVVDASEDIKETSTLAHENRDLITDLQARVSALEAVSKERQEADQIETTGRWTVRNTIWAGILALGAGLFAFIQWIIEFFSHRGGPPGPTHP